MKNKSIEFCGKTLGAGQPTFIVAEVGFNHNGDVELAKKMIQLSGLTIKNHQNPAGDIEICYTGLRHGEKLYEELLLGNQMSKTKHPRIMTSKEVYLTWDKLSPYIDRLKKACLKNDSLSIKTILTEAPLAYTPANSKIIESLDSHKPVRNDKTLYLTKNRSNS